MAKTDDLPTMEGPGVGQKKIIALDNAIEKWRSLVEKRMDLNTQEVEARTRVLEVMHDKGVTSYLYRDNDEEKLCEIIPGKEKVKLKSKDDGGEGEE